MNKPKFLQMHIFYQTALDMLYDREKGLAGQSFEKQSEAIVRDGFSGIHMFGPYMHNVGYESQLIVANAIPAQVQWLRESGIRLAPDKNTWMDVARIQIDTIKPDILYLSEPVSFDSSFVRTLTHKPKLIFGWRAANVAETTDWSSFDVILSNLDALREMALKLGAKATEYFFPGFPKWMWDATKHIQPIYDVTFCGQLSMSVHRKRNAMLDHVASASFDLASPFSCGYYLSGDGRALTPALAKVNKGSRFGMNMQEGLRSGRMVLDGRGDIGLVSASGQAIDLAKKQTSNMRIFEATGSGALLLTEHHDNVSRYFEPGKEIETFRDNNELVDKIRYYVAHPQECEDIAIRGQERCFRDYSMAQRCVEFDRIIKKHLALKESILKDSREDHLSVRASSEVKTGSDEKETTVKATIFDDAVLCLNDNRNSKALELFDTVLTGAHYGKAVALARLGRNSEAKEALGAVLQSAPHHPKATTLFEEIEKSEKAAAQPPVRKVITASESNAPVSSAQLRGLLSKAIQSLKANKLEEAFHRLSAVKATRQRVEGIDYTRAIIFMKINQPLQARESLLEELRFFPGNEDARDLLVDVEKLIAPFLKTELGDDFFKEIFAIIRPYTMLTEGRIFSLYTLAKAACEKDLPGNFIECGVAAGGASAMIARVIKEYSKRPRKHFCFDTFEGMPEPTEKDKSSSGQEADMTGWGTGTCAAPMESLLEVAEKLGVSDIINPVKGYFEDTLPPRAGEIGEIAMMHLDADWYESTLTVLNTLYDQIGVGAPVQLDDFGCWEGCRGAVEEFQKSRGITFNLQPIDGNGVWFAKQR